MLTNQELQDIADQRVLKQLGAAYRAQVLVLADPDGAWVQPSNKEGPSDTAAGGPFFVTRGEGRIVKPVHQDWDRAYTILKRWRDMGVPGAVALYDGTGTPEPAFVAQWVREWLPEVVRRTAGGVTAVDTTGEWEVPPA